MSNSGDNILSPLVSLELNNKCLFLHHQYSANTIHWAPERLLE